MDTRNRRPKLAAGFVFATGGEGGTRTLMSFLTRPSNVRVCQFRHFPLPAFLPPRPVNCQWKTGVQSLRENRDLAHPL